ncbi:hypothetical protein SAVIM40S_03654 [Streptomyces avidinii]
MVEYGHPRTGGQRGQHGLPYGVLVRQVGIEGDGGDRGAAGGGRDDGAVAVVGDQDLVAVGERDGVEGEVGALGGVGDEGDAVGVGAEVPGDPVTGPGEAVRDGDEEGVGVGVDLGAELGLGLLDGDGHRAEGAVVQVGDAGVQAEQGGPAGELVGGSAWPTYRLRSLPHSGMRRGCPPERSPAAVGAEVEEERRRRRGSRMPCSWRTAGPMTSVRQARSSPPP